MITYQRLIFKTFNSILSLKYQNLTTLTAFRFSSQDDNNQNYEYPFNFNREEYRGYIKKVEKAKKQAAEMQQLQKDNIVPRRKRRVYDRPKHDTDLTGYAVWGLYSPQETDIKLFDHSMPVLAKIFLQPKWLVHAIGQGIIPFNNRLNSHREHVFEDNNLSRFILYEYRNTTHYKKNIPNYDYENQEHLRPEMRQVKRLEPEEFWQSEEEFEFRVNGTIYAEHLKFIRWLRETIEKRKTEESFDQMIDKKFGKAFTFNEKEEAELFQPRSPFIMHVRPESFEVKKEEKEKSATKGKKDKKADAAAEKPVQKPVQKSVEQKPAYQFAKQMDEQFRKEVKVEQKKAKSNDF